MADKLERIELALRTLKAANEAELSERELERVKQIALAYPDAELGFGS